MNENHVKLLKSGTEKWHEWKKNNPLCTPDLEDADLKKISYYKVNLDGVKLSRADLSDADLIDVSLKNSILTYATLIGANLTGGDLSGANLKGANLSRVNLTDSTLIGANLTTANLSGATLQGVHLKNEQLKQFALLMARWDYLIVDGLRYERQRLEDSIINSKDTIEHTIEFPPAYHQAGVTILSYFSTYLAQKYPDVAATVRIEQIGLKVSLQIETEDGHKDKVERTLHSYGLIVQGQMPPENDMANTLHVMQLKNQLDLAAAQIKMQDRLIKAIGNEDKSIVEIPESTEISVSGDISSWRRFLGLLGRFDPH